MSLYTSDIDIIYNNIQNGIITHDVVRIISSKFPQSSDILTEFPNVEEILCPIVFSHTNAHTISTLLKSNHKLKRACIVIFVSSNETIDTKRPHKRRRLVSVTPYEKVLTVSIPNIIAQLGSRIKYISLSIIVVDSDNEKYTAVNLDNGIFQLKSDESIKYGEEEIFSALVKSNSLRGFVTDGTKECSLDKISCIPELTIIAVSDCSNNRYLSKLVSLSDTINVIYDHISIEERNNYSEILLDGTSGNIKYLRCIVPPDDLERHITANTDLTEIHSLVSCPADVKIIKDTMLKYSDRDISFFVHYSQDTDEEYWLCLKNYGDVVFNNIIHTLMSF